MNPNENILNSKYRVGMIIKINDKFQSFSCFLEPNYRYLIFRFQASKNQEQTIKQLFQLLSPIFCETEKDKMIYLNYSFIDCFTIDEAKKINFNVINPIFKRKIKMIFTSIEKSNLVFSTKLNYGKSVNLIKTLNGLIIKEKHKMIDRIFYYTRDLLNISNGKSLGKIFDNDSLFKSFVEGKKYYDKSIKELIRQEKIKISINKRIMSESIYFDNYLSTAYNSEFKLNYTLFDNLIQNVKESLMANLDDYIELFLGVNLIDKQIIERGKENIYYLNENTNCDNGNCDFRALIFFGSKGNKPDFFLSNSKQDPNKPEPENIEKEDRKLHAEKLKRFEIKFNLFKESKNNERKIIFNSSILQRKSTKDEIKVPFVKENENELNEKRSNNSDTTEKKHIRSSFMNSLNLDFCLEKTDWSSALMNKTPDFKKHRLRLSDSVVNNKIEHACDEKEKANKKSSLNCKIQSNNDLKILTKEHQGNLETGCNSEPDKTPHREAYKLNPNNIADKINTLKNKHLFSINSSIDEIFNNTIEVIARKYFEYSFEEFFEKTFKYQKDNNGFLKLDSLLSLFFYIRGIKYLVMEDNLQIDYSEFLEKEFEKNIKRMK